MAKIGLPAASGASRCSPAAGMLASQKHGVGRRDLLAQLRPPDLLRERDLVELHVGQCGHYVALAVEQRRVAGRRAVKEHGGEVEDAGFRDRSRDRVAGRVAPAH